MVKLIVQIPCLNEAETLPATLADIPRRIDGIDQVEVLIIDDGSTDGTAEIARRHGADHVIRNAGNKGLAFSFMAGLDACLERGADIIVNTDGDNQYRGDDIAALVAPILAGEADMVVGDRRTQSIAHFSPLKKFLQKVGSRVIRRLSGADVPDAVSGFRAFSARTARSLTVRSSFSYTIETLIQAGRSKFTVRAVPIRTNAVTRPSRLFRSIPQFLMRSGRTGVRAYAMYEPLRVFLGLGAGLVALGAVPIVRFAIHYLQGDGSGMIQSLIIGGVLMLMGALCVMFAMVADLIAFNREISERTLERVRKIEHDLAGLSAPGRGVFPERRIREELEGLASPLPPRAIAGGAAD